MLFKPKGCSPCGRSSSTCPLAYSKLSRTIYIYLSPLYLPLVGCHRTSCKGHWRRSSNSLQPLCRSICTADQGSLRQSSWCRPHQGLLRQRGHGVLKEWGQSQWDSCLPLSLPGMWEELERKAESVQRIRSGVLPDFYLTISPQQQQEIIYLYSIAVHELN